MKKFLSLLIMSFMTYTFSLGFKYEDSEKVSEPIYLSDITYAIEVREIEKTIPTPQPTINPELIKQEAMNKMDEINSIEDKQEWFVAYKEIISEYSEWIDAPESIYDYFSDEELNLLFGVVQAEIGDEWDFLHKVNVANVIFNRLYSEEDNFAQQDSLDKVLVAKEFSTISNGRYKRVKVSETTILACEYAFMIEDTTDGCMAFRSDKNPPEVWEKWKKQYHDGAHWFYK